MNIPYISENEAKELLKLEKKFIKSYAKHKETMSLDKWLQFEFKENLPNKSNEEIYNISKEIIDTIDINESNKSSLKKAIENGRSKESWFTSSVKESLSHMNIKEFGNTLSQLDNVIQINNKAMIDVITTKSGDISRNPNLDGFIAEQHHVNSFNRSASLKGSKYRAEVLVPKEGQTYRKNSVDIVVRDASNKIVQRYQVKYGKIAKNTISMIKKGDYRNQRLVVPEGQVDAIKEAFPGKTVVSEVEFNNIKSEGLTKSQGKELQEKFQDNKPVVEDWNSFNTKQLATKIGKQTGQAALYGAAIGTGFHVAQKVIEGDDIEVEEVVEVAIKTGADAGIKAAISGAIKVGAEKGIINVIPKGTPAHTITNMVHIGIENAKVAKKVFDGDLTVEEAIDEMKVNNVSMVVGSIAALKGSSIGASVGSILGPVGTVVGGFIGGTVGYMAGSEVGKAVTIGAQKIRKVVNETVSNIVNSAKEGTTRVLNSVSSGLRSLLSF